MLKFIHGMEYKLGRTGVKSPSHVSQKSLRSPSIARCVVPTKLYIGPSTAIHSRLVCISQVAGDPSFRLSDGKAEGVFSSPVSV